MGVCVDGWRTREGQSWVDITALLYNTEKPRPAFFIQALTAPWGQLHGKVRIF